MDGARRLRVDDPEAAASNLRGHWSSLRLMNAVSAEIQSETATTPVGLVEYARIGDGAPVLVVHGSPGGYDQGAVLARFVVEAGCEAIVPSRPGYCGTPLGNLRTPDKQAELLMALLDHLGVDRVGVLCWSGGGVGVPVGRSRAQAHHRTRGVRRRQQGVDAG
jgi:hypothetical protein